MSWGSQRSRSLCGTRTGDTFPTFSLPAPMDRSWVVNVKPADRLDKEEIAEALAWAGRVFAERGWEHEVWSGANAQLLANVRFLARLPASVDIRVARDGPSRRSGGRDR